MKKRDMVLLQIAKKPTNSYELSKLLNMKYPNTNAIIRSLEKQGLIYREEVEAKRHFKPKVIHLTERGRKYVEFLLASSGRGEEPITSNDAPLPP